VNVSYLRLLSKVKKIKNLVEVRIYPSFLANKTSNLVTMKIESDLILANLIWIE